MKFHENPSSERQVVPCGQTDRHDEANSLFSQFCERPSKLIKHTIHHRGRNSSSVIY